MGKKSQISLEFISIFVIGLTLTLILGGLFYSVSITEKNSLNVEQINKIGKDLIEYSEQIYFRGSGNKIQYKATFPEAIEYMEIRQFNGGTFNYSELIFGYYTNSGDLSNISFNPAESYIKINCSYSCSYNSTQNYGWFNSSDFNSGKKTLSVRSVGSQVYIDFIR